MRCGRAMPAAWEPLTAWHMAGNGVRGHPPSADPPPQCPGCPFPTEAPARPSCTRRGAEVQPQTQGLAPSPPPGPALGSKAPCPGLETQLLSSHSCCNSQIYSQNEEKPSKHFLHLIPEIPGANRTQKQTLVQIIANNRGFYGGLVHGAVKGFMLLSSISKGKGEGGGRTKTITTKQKTAKTQPQTATT